MPFLIFLDFDGVLHAHWGPASERFYFLPRFETVLRDFPDVQVVIASSWGLRQSLETLRSYFSSDIQPRVIGVSKFTEEHALTWYGRRHRIAAAHRFLELNGFVNRPWVALDDERSFWQPGAPLIECLGGFQEREEFLLRMVLSGELPVIPSAIHFMDELLRIYFRSDPDRARYFFIKHYASRGEEEPSTLQWIEKVFATDPEFIDLLEAKPEEDEAP